MPLKRADFRFDPERTSRTWPNTKITECDDHRDLDTLHPFPQAEMMIKCSAGSSSRVLRHCPNLIVWGVSNFARPSQSPSVRYVAPA